MAAEGAIGVVSEAAQIGTRRELRAQIGREYSDDEAIVDVVTAGVGGALFGGALKAAGRGYRAAARAFDERVKKPTAEQAAARRVVEGEALIEERDPFPEAPGATRAHLRAAAEAMELGEAYDAVRADPQGAWNDFAVSLTPDMIEEVVVSRGAWKDVGDVTINSRRGFGLVKVMWRHGEESGKPAAEQVTRADVMALPDLMRTPPAEVYRDKAGEPLRRVWRTETPDGRVVVASTTRFDPPGVDDGRPARLVSMYVEKGDADAGLGGDVRPPPDTPQASRRTEPGGRAEASPESDIARSAADGEPLPEGAAGPATVDVDRARAAAVDLPDDAFDLDAMRAREAEVDRLIEASGGDPMVAVGTKTLDDGKTVVADMRPLSEVMAEIDAEEAAADELAACAIGAGGRTAG